MQQILIKHTTLIQAEADESAREQVDIRIANGKIVDIQASINEQPDDWVLQGNQLATAPGLVELHSALHEPGNEEHETLAQTLAAATAGGFTALVGMPLTQPAADHKSLIEFLVQKSQNSPTQLLPAGLMTKGALGEELSEMYDMHLSGAIVFSDYKKTTYNTKLLALALQYSSNMNVVLSISATDPYLSKNALAYESAKTTALGLKSMPMISEAIAVERVLSLMRYYGGRVHFQSISTGQAAELIAQAKSENLQVSCDVNFHHLLFSDDKYYDFDTRFKVMPPLVGSEEQSQLLHYLDDNTIDAIAVDHIARNIETKKCEFQNAAFGMMGLENAFSALRYYLDWSTEKLIEKMALAPRKVLGLRPVSIAQGEKAELFVFEKDDTFFYDKKYRKSGAENSPLLDKNLKSKILLTVNGVNFWKNDA